MDLLIGTLMRRRMTARLHDLSPHILRDVGLNPGQTTRNPMKGDKA
jgi:uncharacterized protein YjiS (DUF1127 family)